MQCTTHTTVQCGHDYSIVVTSTKPKACLSGQRPTLPPASQGTLGKFLPSWFLRFLSTTQKSVTAHTPGSLGGSSEDSVQDMVPTWALAAIISSAPPLYKKEPSSRRGRAAHPRSRAGERGRTQFRIQDTWNLGP